MFSLVTAASKSRQLSIPLIYLLAYLGVILLFAYVYSTMSGQFYAPYARFEPSGSRDAYEIGKIFQKEIFAKMQQGGATGGADKISFRPEISGLSGFTTDMERFKFRLTLGVEINNNTFQFSTAAYVDHSALFAQSSGEEPVISRFMTLDFSGQMATFLNSENSNTNTKSIESLLRKIDFTKNEEDMIRRFIAGSNGDATAVSNSFQRMLYFSFVVITTVGFGDIVPMTDLARYLVAAEAFIGIAIAGLFVNSVTNRRTL